MPASGTGTRRAVSGHRAAAGLLAAALFLTACAGREAAAPGVALAPVATPPAGHEAPTGPRDVPTIKLRRPPPRADSRRYEETGLASWYGQPYHGRPTASGQRFDMNALSAAHRTLPFGTRVSVTNLSNGRSVDLVINDRGPYVRGRVIDVSRRGAVALGFLRQGLAEVRVRVLALPDGADAAPRMQARPPGPAAERRWLSAARKLRIAGVATFG